MSVVVKVLINQSDISITNSTLLVEYFSTSTGVSVNSDGTDRTMRGWLEFICDAVIAVSGDQLQYVIDGYEFILFRSDIQSTIEIKNQVLADIIGFEKDKTYSMSSSPHETFGEAWGTYRLVLQGAESTIENKTSYSRMILPERITGKSKNETFESIDYVINSFDKRFDMKRWKVFSHWLTTEKEQWVKDFIHEAVNNKNSDNCKLFGDDFWIENTEVWKILSDAYDGIKIDVGHRKYVKFSLGLREVL